jgi:hypothetical protein
MMILENVDMMRVFLLSPAKSNGRRAALLMSRGATFELARQLQAGAATLGDVFAFCSGLYFRGKLAYARRFAQSPAAIQIITPSRGLLSPDTLVGIDEMNEFSAVSVETTEARFTGPLHQHATAIKSAGPCQAVLLGSIASNRYVGTLLPIFAEQLLFPIEFVGRGDMSRGGLMLRCVKASHELDYVPVTDAVRTGRRPPKLSPEAAR